jgi:hypothetical protein
LERKAGLSERNVFPAKGLPLLLRKDFHERKAAKVCRSSDRKTALQAPQGRSDQQSFPNRTGARSFDKDGFELSRRLCGMESSFFTCLQLVSRAPQDRLRHNLFAAAGRHNQSCGTLFQQRGGNHASQWQRLVERGGFDRLDLSMAVGAEHASREL